MFAGVAGRFRPPSPGYDARPILRNSYAAAGHSLAQFDGPRAHSPTIKEDTPMTVELWLGAGVALVVRVYLVAVLARPEKF